ncbi:hypothetical protein FHR22_002127 [Sphingopyxis panaciterrae]|uniref:NADP-dependent oxidoreductase n=1 Tax=Sphingopyxis panaciterrae TaxID=363841 RepID=UPI00142186AC|nr:NADP-dependent oxidoreductase [Sphingopyxis panaciterrae]NIJ37443.1 hypothetical protein [Sphingopyxis panaciterrae]
MENRQWLLRRRPVRMLRDGDLELAPGDQHERALQAGEIRVRNLLFLYAPTMRNWMSARDASLHMIIPLGAPIQAMSASRIVESRHPAFPVGSRIVSTSKWSEFDIIDAASAPRLIDEGVTAIEALGAFGLNAMTGYFGLMRVGRPSPGETLVVSGAAGSTGSVAAQIGRIAGCRVIGIAGGAEKCSWLRNECRIEEVIDYRSDDVSSALKSLCPTGIDIFFDNVGGTMLQAAVDNMAKFGRIILCGQIAGYNSEDDDLPAFRNIMRVIYGSIRIQGFLFGDYRDEVPEAIADLIAWRQSGEIVTREDIRTGFETLPLHFNALFEGTNRGTLLGLVDEDAYSSS